KAAGCVVVLWSKESVRSRWVRAEASSAAGRNCLIPVLIDDAQLPLEFTLIQGAELRNWNGDTTHPEFSRLAQAVQEMLRKPASTGVETRQHTSEIPYVDTRPRRPNRAIGVSILAAVLLVALILGRSWFSSVPADTKDPTSKPSTTSDASVTPSPA